MTDIAEIKARDMKLDIIKGLGIILMVWIHGGGPFGHFINLFHMPIFFMASGFLWNEKNADAFFDLTQYIKRKLASLWKPFVMFNGILVLLHNLFLKFGLYTDCQTLLEYFPDENNKIQYALSAKEIFINLFKTMLFAHTAQLGSPTWFIRTLFIITIMFAVVRFIDRKILRKNVFTCFTFCASGAIATLISIFNVQMPFGGSNVFAAFFLYVVGVWMKKLKANCNFSQHNNKNTCITLVLSMVVLLICNWTGTVAFSSGRITNILFLLVASIAGWQLLYSLAELFPKKVKSCLSYIGRNSLVILLFHLLCFKIVSIIYTLATSKEWVFVAAFPSIKNVTGLWIAYLIIGVIGPLLLSLFNNKFKELLWRK